MPRKSSKSSRKTVVFTTVEPEPLLEDRLGCRMPARSARHTVANELSVVGREADLAATNTNPFATIAWEYGAPWKGAGAASVRTTASLHSYSFRFAAFASAPPRALRSPPARAGRPHVNEEDVESQLRASASSRRNRNEVAVEPCDVRIERSTFDTRSGRPETRARRWRAPRRRDHGGAVRSRLAEDVLPAPVAERGPAAVAPRRAPRSHLQLRSTRRARPRATTDGRERQPGCDVGAAAPAQLDPGRKRPLSGTRSALHRSNEGIAAPHEGRSRAGEPRLGSQRPNAFSKRAPCGTSARGKPPDPRGRSTRCTRCELRLVCPLCIRYGGRHVREPHRPAPGARSLPGARFGVFPTSVPWKSAPSTFAASLPVSHGFPGSLRWRRPSGASRPPSRV